VQHLIIEPKIVESNHQIGPLYIGQQIIDLLFPVDSVFLAGGAVSHADAHPHLADFVPAADVLGGFLRFQIEINNIFRHKIMSGLLCDCCCALTTPQEQPAGKTYPLGKNTEGTPSLHFVLFTFASMQFSPKQARQSGKTKWEDEVGKTKWGRRSAKHGINPTATHIIAPLATKNGRQDQVKRLD
jgi:hypothetical protein